jgi:hypothetical protein
LGIVSASVRIGDKILFDSPLILSVCARGIAQGGHELLLVGSGAAASSWTMMRWPSVALAAGDLGSVSSPRREEEGRGRLGRAMGRWAASWAA